MALNTSPATYKDAKGTRIYVAVLTEDEVAVGSGWDGTEADVASANWHMVGGVRSDREETQQNQQQTYHYGEADAVSTSSPPSRSVNVDTSYAPDNIGQQILRWAQLNNKTIGVQVLYDGVNGYAVEATVGAGGGSGDAQGGLRAGSFTINPIGQRVKVGTSDVWVPA